jgi:hypothetical protein
MPRKSPNAYNIQNSIPEIYKNSYIDIALYNFVTACLKCGVNQTDAMFLFREQYLLDEDSAPITSLLVKYWRLNKQFLNTHRKHGKVIVSVGEVDHTNYQVQIAASVKMLSNIIADMRKKS